jgi:phospholipid/cholesterol/gamma-HCH transport system substrate-binding protein
MRGRVLWSQLRIGLVVTLTIAAASVLIFFIDEFRQAVQERYTLQFDTYTHQTLRRGAHVWLAGQPVGQVSRIEFVLPSGSENERLRVFLSIRRNAQPHITEGAVAQVTTAGLLGEAVVNILPADEPAPPLPPGAALPAAPEIDPKEAMRQLRTVYDSLPGVIDVWRQVFEQMQSGDGSLPLLMQQPDDLRRLQLNLTDMASRFDAVGSTAAGLASLLDDPSIRVALRRIVPRLDTLRESWQGGAGTLGSFATDTLLAVHLDGIRANVERIDDRIDSGRGTLGRLLNDRALERELRRTREMLEELRADLRGGAVGR